MEDTCGETISMDEHQIPAGRLSVTNKSKYREALSCHVTIQAPPFMRLTFVFREMDIEYEVRCDDDFVTFYDGPTMRTSIIPGTHQRMCGHKVPTGNYVTSGHSLTIFFRSDIIKQDNGFEIVFTAFHKNSKCLEDEFRCDNGRCIAGSLRCNDFNNCGDASDKCQIDSSVAVALICSTFLMTIIGAGTITLYRKRKKRQRAHKEPKADIFTPRLQSMSMTSMNEVQIVPCNACANRIIDEQRRKLGSKYTPEFLSQISHDWPMSKENNGFYFGESSSDGAESAHDYCDGMSTAQHQPNFVGKDRRYERFRHVFGVRVPDNLDPLEIKSDLPTTPYFRETPTILRMTANAPTTAKIRDTLSAQETTSDLQSTTKLQETATEQETSSDLRSAIKHHQTPIALDPLSTTNHREMPIKQDITSDHLSATKHRETLRVPEMSSDVPTAVNQQGMSSSINTTARLDTSQSQERYTFETKSPELEHKKDLLMDETHGVANS